MFRRTLIRSLLSLPLAFAGVPARAKPRQRKKVIVATETWGKLLYADASGAPAGLLDQFIDRMNEVQDKFQFEVAIYPRLRLDALFAQKKADVYPLRTLDWVSPKMNLQATRTIVTSGDLYFARKANHFGGEKVFDQIGTRIVAGVRGYHYRLFGNVADEAAIRKNFKAELLGSNEAVVQFVLADRADVGIVPEMIMADYLRDPAMREQLIIGPYDSRVELSNLVRRGGPVSVREMNAIVDLLVKAGDVARLRAALGVAPLKP
jgi:ABC-type amino acid transport substrate-binding protein